jgi:hypothetical protein
LELCDKRHSFLSVTSRNTFVEQQLDAICVLSAKVDLEQVLPAFERARQESSEVDITSEIQEFLGQAGPMLRKAGIPVLDSLPAYLFDAVQQQVRLAEERSRDLVKALIRYNFLITAVLGPYAALNHSDPIQPAKINGFLAERDRQMVNYGFSGNQPVRANEVLRLASDDAIGYQHEVAQRFGDGLDLQPVFDSQVAEMVGLDSKLLARGRGLPELT